MFCNKSAHIPPFWQSFGLGLLACTRSFVSHIKNRLQRTLHVFDSLQSAILICWQQICKVPGPLLFSLLLGALCAICNAQSYEICWRPYQVECTGSLLTSEVKRLRAPLVLGWGTAWEHLRVLSAFVLNYIFKEGVTVKMSCTQNLSSAKATKS